MLDPRLSEQLQVLLAQASPETVPSGILVWWGSELLPDGGKNAPALSQSLWNGCYTLLTHGALSGGWMPSLPSLTEPLLQAPQDGPIPLAIAHYRYARPKKKVAAAFNKAVRKRSHLQDPPKDLGSALKEQTVFMARCVMTDQWAQAEPMVRARLFQLVIDRSCYLSTPGLGDPDELRVDAGRGEKKVQFGDRVTCRVDEGDSLTIVVRARFGEEWLEARCSVGISDSPTAPSPCEVWPLSVPGGLTGRASVYRSTAIGDKRRYFIMAEGFPGGYAAHYLYDNLNQHGLLETLRAAGYDVVTIGFDYGALTIERNAEVVIECIMRANATNTGHVVGGVSMGGLITRYALAAMEQRKVAHNAAIYLTIDSPHQGSRTSVSNQWFAHYFARMVPGMSDASALLDSPANQQFLEQWYHDGTVIESDLRKRLYASYKLMGDYPQQLKRYAVASGPPDGKTTLAAGSKMVSWEGSALATATLNTLPEGDRGLVGEGTAALPIPGVPAKLEVASPVSWEGVAGSLSSYNDQVLGAIYLSGIGSPEVITHTACVVPTISALDLKQDPHAPIPPPGMGDSPFHDYVCAESSLHHIAIDPRIRDWLVQKLTNYINE